MFSSLSKERLAAFAPNITTRFVQNRTDHFTQLLGVTPRGIRISDDNPDLFLLQATDFIHPKVSFVRSETS